MGTQSTWDSSPTFPCVNMQRQLISAAVLLVLVAAATAIDMEKLSTRDYDYNATCMERLGSHIQVELQASITYLTMAAWANHYAVQRPGLAKMFFESASEERTHALAMLDYVRMRGLNTLSLLPESLVTFFFLFFSCDHRQKDL